MDWGDLLKLYEEHSELREKFADAMKPKGQGIPRE